MKRNTLVVAVFVLTLFGQGIAYAKSVQWNKPTFPAEKSKEKKLVITENYNYKEIIYKEGQYVQQADKTIKNDTADNGFIIRMSAILNKDFEWWLNTWDEQSRKEVLERDTKQGHDKSYWVDQWNHQFSDVKIKPIRKIQFSDNKYVIITYKIFTKDNKDISAGFELPMVLKNINGSWFNTADLKSDPIVMFSPWVSGNNIERTIF
jgi:hypothetical protein